MKIHQKGFANILLIVIVVMVVGAVGYFAFVKKSEPTSQQPTPELVNWESLIPNIRTVLGPVFLDTRIEDQRAISIYKKTDITGDGVPEALVNLGTGGAYTNYVTLMMVENEKPVVARFKQKDGKVSPLIFLEGASVANGESVVMIANKNAVYNGHWSRVISGEPYGGLSNCSVEAYRWDTQTKTFNFNLSLTNEIRLDYCREVDIGNSLPTNKSINPIVKVVSPNGNESLEVGGKFIIQWTIDWGAAKIANLTTISLVDPTKQGELAHVKTIALELPASLQTKSYSYDWTIPDVILPGSYKIDVYTFAPDVYSVGDQSDTTFSITK